MHLQLDKDFYIAGDLNSFVLHYEHLSGKFNAKREEIVSRDQWYYSNIRDCLMSYRDRASGMVFGKTTEGEIIRKYDELGEKIGGIKEFVWTEKDTLAYSLMEENRELKNRRK